MIYDTMTKPSWICQDKVTALTSMIRKLTTLHKAAKCVEMPWLTTALCMWQKEAQEQTPILNASVCFSRGPKHMIMSLAYLPFYDIFYNILRSFILTPVRQSVDHQRSFSTSVTEEKGIPQKKVYVDRIPICRE